MLIVEYDSSRQNLSYARAGEKRYTEPIEPIHVFASALRSDFGCDLISSLDDTNFAAPFRQELREFNGREIAADDYYVPSERHPQASDAAQDAGR